MQTGQASWSKGRLVLQQGAQQLARQRAALRVCQRCVLLGHHADTRVVCVVLAGFRQ